MKRYILLFSLILAGSTLAILNVGTHHKFSASEEVTKAGQAVLPDFKDPKVLVGYSDNVFAAKLLNKAGTMQLELTGGRTANNSQYVARVISNVKGKLRGSVIVNQGELPNHPLLQVGSTYLFSAKYSRQYDFYDVTLVPDNYQLISDNDGLDDVQLSSLVEENNSFKRLRDAYPDEIPFALDVRNGHSFNRYTSRHYDAQGNLIDDTVVLHEQYLAAHPSVSSTNELQPNVPAANKQTPPVASESLAPSPTPAESVEPTLAPTPEESASPTPTPTQVEAGTPTPTDTPIPTDVPQLTPAPTI
jgi:hypothetical protein